MGGVKAARQPWLKFFPADWRQDIDLSVCSLAARGLWIEMLSIMWQAEPCGSLVHGGKPMSMERLAQHVRASVKEVRTIVDELREANVFSVDDDGVIYSRRMRRDVEKAERDRANGKGGGNPNLKGGVNPPDNPPLNPAPNPTDKGGDKAHMPEARSQKPEARKIAAAASGPTPTSLSPFEAECRHLLEPEPVMLAQDFHVVTALFETGITEDDVRTGLREALTKRADPRQRFRSWTQLVGWCRTAAKNRLAAGPQAGARQAVPNGEPQVSLGSVVWPETSVRKAVQRFRIDPSSWPLIIGDPPGSPGCLVPDRLLIGAAA